MTPPLCSTPAAVFPSGLRFGVSKKITVSLISGRTISEQARYRLSSMASCSRFRAWSGEKEPSPESKSPFSTAQDAAAA